MDKNFEHSISNHDFVAGQHQAIISEQLFFKVQDIVDRRKKVTRPKVEAILGSYEKLFGLYNMF